MKYIKLLIVIVTLFFSYEIIFKSKEKLLAVNIENNMIDLKNPTILTKKNISTFKANLVNNSNKEKYINKIEIIIKDNTNTVICNFDIEVNKKLLVSDNIEITTNVNYDLSDAISFDYIIN